jgi:hypothetical protein
MIQIICPSCKTKLSAPDSMAGKKGKCSCGQIFAVPVPTVKPIAAAPANSKPFSPVSTTPRQSKPTTSNPSKPVASNQPTATQPKPQYNTSRSAAPSAFDQLPNQQSFSAFNPYALGSNSFASPYAATPKPDQAAIDRQLNRSDAAFVDKIAVSSGVVHIVGAVTSAGSMLMILLGSGVVLAGLHVLNAGQTPDEIQSIVTKTLVFAAVYYPLSIAWNIAIAIGMFRRATWGWWLCMCGLVFALFQLLGGISTDLFVNGRVAVPRICSAMTIIVVCTLFLVLLSSKPSHRVFNIQMKPAKHWPIIVGVAFCLALFSVSGDYVAKRAVADLTPDLDVEA